MSLIKNRILQFADNKGINKEMFFKKINSSYSNFRGKSKNSSPSTDVIVEISSNYPDVSINWLLTGKGKMLKEEAVTEESKPVMIPFYDGIAIGGTQEIATMDSITQPTEYIDTGDWFRDATAAMRVHGDSMHPVYKSGSIVALKTVNNKQLVIYGQDYVVETDEYRVIKRLQKAGEKPYWSCYSINEDKYLHNNRLIHEPFDVSIDSVNKLFKVLGCVIRTESSLIVFNTND